MRQSGSPTPGERDCHSDADHGAPCVSRARARKRAKEGLSSWDRKAITMTRQWRLYTRIKSERLNSYTSATKKGATDKWIIQKIIEDID